MARAPAPGPSRRSIPLVADRPRGGAGRGGRRDEAAVLVLLPLARAARTAPALRAALRADQRVEAPQPFVAVELRGRWDRRSPRHGRSAAASGRRAPRACRAARPRPRAATAARPAARARRAAPRSPRGRPLRTTSSGSWPAGSATKRSVRSGPRWGRARSAARTAAFCPAASPSKQQIGAGSSRHSRSSCASVSAVPIGRDRLADPGAVEGDDVHIAFDDDQPLRPCGWPGRRGRGCRACGPCRTAACRAS